MTTTLRGLSLWQPWASLVVAGLKVFETRDWLTTYRGFVAIHASKHLNPGIEYGLDAEVVAAYREAGFGRVRDMPRGCIVGLVLLRDCEPSEGLYPRISRRERALGNYGPGRYGFRLSDPVALPAPIPCRGNLNLFHLPMEVEAQILATVAQSPGLVARAAAVEAPPA